MSRFLRLVLLAALLLMVIGWLVSTYFRSTTSTAPASGPANYSGPADNLLLGNPSNAVADFLHENNYLLVKPYYTLSYNSGKGISNWVSWRVTAADTGTAPRKQLFDTDPTLPRGMKRITHSDYSTSGFDRGHLCPHDDRSANREMSYATFVMTNIIPQAPNLNQKAWAYLERYCRTLAREGHHLYIVAGPVGSGGVGTKGRATSIARGKITVPAECWKVIVIVPEGSRDDLRAIDTDTRVIAVIMPNRQDAAESWKKYRVSVNDVEKRTGYRFFSALPAPVATALKSKVDRER